MPARRAFGDAAHTTKAGCRSRDDTGFQAGWERRCLGWRLEHHPKSDEKNRQNLLKHGLRFETAVLIFYDPCALTERDVSLVDEERWNTLGAIAPEVVLFVVHTWPERKGKEGYPQYPGPACGLT